MQSFFAKPAPFQFQFVKDHPFHKRAEEALRVLYKFPDRVPCIIECDPRAENMTLDKKKYLVPGNVSWGELQFIIRKRIRLNKSEALHFFTNERLVPATTLLSSVYQENKSDDHFLYILVSKESTFGARA